MSLSMLPCIFFRQSTFLAGLVFLGTGINAAPAVAYVGPGAGLTAIGTMVAVILAILLALVGFVWYPLKRLLHKRREEPEHEVEVEGQEAREPE